MRNRHPGACYRCGKQVAAYAGHFERVTSQRLAELGAPRQASRWLTQHAECAIQWRGTNHSRWSGGEKEKLVCRACGGDGVVPTGSEISECPVCSQEKSND